jgi:hypothetical protein
MIAWTMSAAWAVTSTFCVNYDVDFVDSDVPSATEDYYHDNGIKPALGILVKATSTLASASGHAATSGPSAGCVTLSLPAGTYTVTVESVIRHTPQHVASVLNGKKNLSGVHLPFSHVGLSGWVATAGTTPIQLPTRPHWDTAAAVGQTFERNRGGRPSFNLKVYVPEMVLGNPVWNLPASCPTSGSCLNGTDLWLVSEDTDRKFTIAYRLGWAILAHMGYDRAALDKTAEDYHCRANDSALALGNLEHTKTAFAEGYAFWFAATAFNQSDQADCSMVYGRASNWDLLEACHQRLEAGVGHVLSCATGPSLPPYEPLVGAQNYRQYCKDRSPGFELSTYAFPGGAAVPLDVMRFLHTTLFGDSNMTRSKVGNAFAASVNANSSVYYSNLRIHWSAQGGDVPFFNAQGAEHGVDP